MAALEEVAVEELQLLEQQGVSKQQVEELALEELEKADGNQILDCLEEEMSIADLEMLVDIVLVMRLQHWTQNLHCFSFGYCQWEHEVEALE